MLVAAARGSATCGMVVVRAIADHELVLSAPILAEYLEVGQPQSIARITGCCAS